ncbi:sensor histidine kinase [Cohnella sp. GCM10020058]|uniref:sensor histidine kinase n=1 Tax=Cohnella sp. GCM10020058 TaxID=3317330 RepID=UPI0036349FF9
MPDKGARAPGASGMRGLARKMILGYLLVVLLPMLVLGPFVYRHFQRNLIEEYASGKQQLAEHAYTNFKVQLAQVEALYGVIQYNANLIELLSGNYGSELDQTYNYLKYISPMFKYIHSANTVIDDVKIYTVGGVAMRLSDELTPIDESPEEAARLSRLGTRGEWSYAAESPDRLGELAFRQKIYNEEYTRALGLLVIRFKPAGLSPFLSSMRADNPAVGILLTDGNAPVFRQSGEAGMDAERESRIIGLAKAGGGQFPVTEGSSSLNGLYVEELGLWAVAYGSPSEDFPELRSELNTVFAVMLALLVLLSVIYYFFAARVTGRILRLAKHMRRVGEHNLKPFQGEESHDEIGFLTRSFNAMISRIDELVNEVQREQILRREAAYAALQAQIKPHFLYNTLESLRMLAEAVKAREVADMCFAFGRLIRYSLSHDGDTTLGVELKHVAYYLQIYRLRMGEDRLAYRIASDKALEAQASPRFILQPLVENCIVHGFAGLRRLGTVEIVVRADDEGVTIAVRDDGHGMTEDRLSAVRASLYGGRQDPEAQSGMGLANVHERIGIFYGGASGLRLKSAPDEGTACEIRIERRRSTP